MKNAQKKLFGLTSSLLVLGVLGHSALAQISTPQTPTIPGTPSTPVPLPTPIPTSPSTPTLTPTPGSTPTSTTTPTPSVSPTPGATTTPSPTTTSTPIPTSTPTPTLSPSPGSASSTKSTVVGIASADSNFKTLTKALKASGLDKKLSGPGPFTVFAPTDKAFAALPPNTLATLLKPANKQKLISLLNYHIVSGQEKSTDLKAGSVPTLAGRSVTVKVQPSGITVNNAKVVKADITASNGIIHAVDKVLMPTLTTKPAAPAK
jgi:uncharacterized surface protein with fasciclin (FAS1) repeats